MPSATEAQPTSAAPDAAEPQARRLAKAPGRIPSLDGLRAISIALVVYGHVCGSRWFPLRSSGFTAELAQLGVRVFFVISGFLITTLLLKEQERTGRIDLLEFYRRRAYRILPPALVYMVIITALFWHELSRRDLLLAYTYTVNWGANPHIAGQLGHLWSLSVEEQFYLLWPFVLALFFSRRMGIAAAVLLVAPVVRVALYHAAPEWTVERWFPAVADCLATGCLLAMARPWLKRWAWLASRWMLLWPAAVVGTLLLQAHPHVYYGAGISFMNVGIAVTLEHVLRRNYRVLNVAPVVWVGLLSYSLYLWQQPVIYRTRIVFPLNVLLAVALAACSYYLVEQPALRLRARRSRAKQTVAAASV